VIEIEQGIDRKDQGAGPRSNPSVANPCPEDAPESGGGEGDMLVWRVAVAGLCRPARVCRRVGAPARWRGDPRPTARRGAPAKPGHDGGRWVRSLTRTSSLRFPSSSAKAEDLAAMPFRGVSPGSRSPAPRRARCAHPPGRRDPRCFVESVVAVCLGEVSCSLVGRGEPRPTLRLRFAHGPHFDRYRNRSCLPCVLIVAQVCGNIW